MRLPSLFSKRLDRLVPVHAAVPCICSRSDTWAQSCFEGWPLETCFDNNEGPTSSVYSRVIVPMQVLCRCAMAKLGNLLCTLLGTLLGSSRRSVCMPSTLHWARSEQMDVTVISSVVVIIMLIAGLKTRDQHLKYYSWNFLLVNVCSRYLLTQVVEPNRISSGLELYRYCVVCIVLSSNNVLCRQCLCQQYYDMQVYPIVGDVMGDDVRLTWSCQVSSLLT